MKAVIEKLKQFANWIQEKKIHKVIVIILVVATLLRIYMAVKIPLFAQAGADYDDFLMIKYADSILAGNWLGPFGLRTLAKGVSFSIFIVLTYLLGIPYSLALILVYIGAIIVFIVAIKKLIPNKWFLIATYLALLFSPVMFHIENTQKIYRGGLIVSMALLIVAAMIGLYTRRYEKRSTLVKWSLLAGISLSFFWFLKEDSIWILPFVIGAMLIIIIDLCQHKPKIDKIRSKIIITILPVILLVFANLGYCLTNYLHYGVFTVTDRTGTYFTDMIHELLLIEDEQDIKNIWITKDMMYQAIEVSPTLQSIEEEIDDMYEHSWALEENGEIEGDIIYWTFKEAVDQAGIYEQGGQAVNDFYRKVTDELQTAFEENKLKKEKAIFLSSVAKGLTDEAWDYFATTTPEAIDTIVTYKENETSVNVATGPYLDVVLMDHLTNSTIIWPDEMSVVAKPFTYITNFTNQIVAIYQITGWPLFILGCLGFILLTIQMIKSIRQKTYQEVPLWLITTGLFGTIAILLLGVEWFCNFFGFSTMRHLYNYTCGMIPLLQIFELIGVYYVIKMVKKIWKNKRDRVVYKSNKIR